MNIYHCLIELKSDAKALAFGAAVGNWMGHLQSLALIDDWRLLRRKFGLASGVHCDFILEITVDGLGQLDTTFAALSQTDEEAARLYDQMHQLIGTVSVGLYRPYPDPAYRERIALI